MVDSYPERMVRRLAPPPPDPAALNDSLLAAVNATAPPPWRIEIPAADGTPLLVMREENGRLAADYDPLKLTEAARALLLEMLRMAGGAGINWKDEARKT